MTRKQHNVRMGLRLCTGILLWLAIMGGTFAAPVKPEQAREVGRAWLGVDPQPLNVALSPVIRQVVRYTDDQDQPLYYVLELSPSGFVIVPADDWIEPILAFAPKGSYSASASSSLGALVERDIRGRMAYVRSLQNGIVKSMAPSDPVCRAAYEKWRRWITPNAPGRASAPSATASISDVWVAPLVQSEWDQAEDGGGYCYNYWTPNHYVCGCGATAMAQLMRYHQWPITGVGTPSFEIYVDGYAQMRALRGSDGLGSAYNWNLMTLDPGAGASEAERQAIGAICHDAGVAVNMDYTDSVSGMDFEMVSPALRDTFSYSSVIIGYNNGANLVGQTIYAMLNPSLDAGYPALLAIYGEVGGHAVVCDGYGFNAGSLYHHINVGWGAGGETANTWYALPIIDPFDITFSAIYVCAYNIFPSGGGEIISGRVADRAGNPLSGATVIAARNGGGTWTGVSNSRGIYALRVPASSTYTLSVIRSGYTFPAKTVSTGRSTDYESGSGSRWGNNFAGTIDIASPPVYHPVSGDYNGDHTADPALYAADSGIWRVWLLGNQYSFFFSGGSALSAAADYDGDGKIDPAVYMESTGIWTVFFSGSGYVYGAFKMGDGSAGAGIASADYDGDGRADPALYNDRTRLWNVFFSGTGYQVFNFSFGGNGCTVVSADYDNDGKADPALYQASSGVWAVMLSTAGYLSATTVFGGGGNPESGGYLPAVADYNGDKFADPAVYQETTSQWMVLLSNHDAAGGYYQQDFTLGGPGYRQATADYDGDDCADPAVYQDASGSWIVMLSGLGYQSYFLSWGGAGQ